MKNLFLILLSLFIWDCTNAQLALSDSTYIAKIPGNSSVGLFHTENGRIGLLDEFGERNIFFDPGGYLWTVKNTPTIASLNIGAVHIHQGSQWNIGLASLVPVDTLGSVAAYLSGDVQIFGSLYFPSDQNLKKNIRTIDNVLPKIMELNPTSYEYLEKYDWAKGEQTGLIAQELKSVFPHLVSKKTMFLQNESGAPSGEQQGFQAINYIGLISILTKGIQEQQTIVEDQEDRIIRLENQMKRLLAQQQEIYNNENTKTQTSQELSLEQNFPNPFSATTTIKCRVPSTTSNAYLTIQTLEGRQLQQIKIPTGVNHFERLDLTNFPKGIYFYSLFADGQILMTKKMQVVF